MKERLPLRSFRLQNFKAVLDSGTVSFGPLTVFIGNNGSGKSSLVEGLETFCDIVLNGLDAAMTRWRGFEHVWNKGARHKLIHPALRRPHHTGPMAFHLKLRTADGVARVRQEVGLGEGGNELFLLHEQILRKNAAVEEWHLREADGKQKHFLNKKPAGALQEGKIRDGQSILDHYLGPELSRWQFLNLVPDAMGQPVPQQRAAGHIRLARNGANIAEYLHDIYRSDVDAFNSLIESLRYVLPFAEDLQPDLASELQREFYLKLKEEQFEVPGWLLSTGTLRILALLACLRHPDPPPLLVVEELENGLDPRTLHLVVEEIRAAIAAGRTQVIATTHSPYLLDLLDLSHIVVVERIDGQPTFRRPDPDELAAWAKSFSPGRLYTMGRLTRGD